MTFQEKRSRQDERKKVAKALGDKAPPKLVPHTIDNMREPDETTVAPPTEVDEKVDEVGYRFFICEILWNTKVFKRGRPGRLSN